MEAYMSIKLYLDLHRVPLDLPMQSKRALHIHLRG